MVFYSWLYHSLPHDFFWRGHYILGINSQRWQIIAKESFPESLMEIMGISNPFNCTCKTCNMQRCVGLQLKFPAACYIGSGFCFTRNLVNRVDRHVELLALWDGDSDIADRLGSCMMFNQTSPMCWTSKRQHGAMQGPGRITFRVRFFHSTSFNEFNGKKQLLTKTYVH